jgi:hypothetical protein
MNAKWWITGMIVGFSTKREIIRTSLSGAESRGARSGSYQPLMDRTREDAFIMTVTWKAGARSNILQRAPIYLPWFKKRDYPGLQRIVNDPKVMPLSFEEWQERSEVIERRWKRDNRLVVRVIVDPDTFIAYCAARAEKPSGKLLREFASAWIEAGKATS